MNSWKRFLSLDPYHYCILLHWRLQGNIILHSMSALQTHVKKHDLHTQNWHNDDACWPWGSRQSCVVSLQEEKTTETWQETKQRKAKAITSCFTMKDTRKDTLMPTTAFQSSRKYSHLENIWRGTKQSKSNANQMQITVRRTMKTTRKPLESHSDAYNSFEQK